jgi:hypothetical protein
MKGSHLFWLSRSKGTTVDIWIRDDNPPMCFQKKISGRSKHNGRWMSMQCSSIPSLVMLLVVCVTGIGMVPKI